MFALSREHFAELLAEHQFGAGETEERSAFGP